MPLRTECPECGAQFSLDPSLRGRRVRCRDCGDSFVVRDRSQRPDADEHDEDRFRQRSGSNTGLIIGLSVGGGVFLLALVTTVVLMVLQPWKKDEPPPVVQNPFPFGNPPVEKNPFVNPPINNPIVNPPVIPNPFVPPPPVVENGDPITRAIAQLRSDDIFSQSDACKALAGMAVDAKRRDEVVQALKGVSDNRRPLIPRREAVHALGTWCTAADVPYLIRLLDDRDGGVQEEAIFALGKMKDVRAADPLASCVSNGSHREQAADALMEIGAAAEPVVLKLLQGHDDGVRTEAIKILKRIGTAASHPALVELANDDNQGIAKAARDALPEKLRPPIWGPKQTIKVNVHVANFAAWPAMETKIKSLADAPKPKCKSWRSGEYMWVDLAPVDGDPAAFARKLENFFGRGSLVAVHTDQRLIYIESGR
jgi:predicted Zn finger-like uncharacterized protein